MKWTRIFIGGPHNGRVDTNIDVHMLGIFYVPYETTEKGRYKYAQYDIALIDGNEAIYEYKGHAYTKA